MSQQEVAHKPPTRREADAKRQAEGEAAFRAGFVARANQETRAQNPYTLPNLLADARQMVMYPGTSQQRPYTEGEARARANTTYPQVEHSRNCWCDGWDTAHQTAAVKGEAALAFEATRLLTPKLETKPKPPKYDDQPAMFGDDEVPAEKRKRETDWEKLRKWTGKSEHLTTADEQ